MRIAQVSPLFERVPPLFYGGTERIVSYLTEELVRQGHEVTLFASGDSITAATLVPCCPQALRLDAGCFDPIPHHLVMLERIFDQAARFDVIHFHTDYLHYSAARRFGLTHVTTLHGRLNIPDLVPLYREYPDMPVTSISDSQRVPLPWLNWRGTVHHGLPRDLLSLNPRPDEYLAFLGRISPEKGLPAAIAIARRSGRPLRIAAKIDKGDQDYFESAIKPQIDGDLIRYVGEIGEREKIEFLGRASALLFPIDWEEPFGLVMIEAMACGTPVIAFRRGSVPEVLEQGVSGFIVEDLEQAVEAVERIRSIDRQRCRSAFETRFSATRMASDYLTIYENLVNEKSDPVRRLAPAAGKQEGALRNATLSVKMGVGS